MKKRFTEEQILAILQEQQEHLKNDCSENTFYIWKRKYDDMSVSEVTRLRKLEDEKTKIKRIVTAWEHGAEGRNQLCKQSNDKVLHSHSFKLCECSCKKLLQPEVKCTAVEQVKNHFGHSEIKACRVLAVTRTTARYKPKQKNDNCILELIKTITARYPRYNCSMIYQKLRKTGLLINHK